MAKKNKKKAAEEVVEEVKNNDEVTKVELEKKVEDLMDADVVKVDLSKPPKTK